MTRWRPKPEEVRQAWRDYAAIAFGIAVALACYGAALWLLGRMG